MFFFDLFLLLKKNLEKKTSSVFDLALAGELFGLQLWYFYWFFGLKVSGLKYLGLTVFWQVLGVFGYRFCFWFEVLTIFWFEVLADAVLWFVVCAGFLSYVQDFF